MFEFLYFPRSLPQLLPTADCKKIHMQIAHLLVSVQKTEFFDTFKKYNFTNMPKISKANREQLPYAKM